MGSLTRNRESTAAFCLAGCEALQYGQAEAQEAALSGMMQREGRLERTTRPNLPVAYDVIVAAGSVVVETMVDAGRVRVLVRV